MHLFDVRIDNTNGRFYISVMEDAIQIIALVSTSDLTTLDLGLLDYANRAWLNCDIALEN